MIYKKATVIVLIVLISCTCAQDDSTAANDSYDRKKTTTSTTVTPITWTTTGTPTTSTVAPTTSTGVPTISTSVPTTSTVAPTTSTVAPTTSTVAPTTSTVAPTTSTVAPTTSTSVPTTTIDPITTTVAPTPQPQPDYKLWTFEDKDKVCVLAQMAMQLNFTYKKADDKKVNVLFNIPANITTVVGGSCGKDVQLINVGWGQKSQMSLQFTANQSAQQFMLSEIHLTLNVSDIYQDAKANQTIELYHVNKEFPTSLSMSYHCNKMQPIGFTNSTDGKDIVANATISHVQLEAFHTQKTKTFSTARDCEAIDTPDIVPIAVGCALAGLVVIVLIAYLVGRRRRQARGYMSM